MEYERRTRNSSGVAKAALATGITGAALGVLNGGVGLLGGLGGNPVGATFAHGGGYVSEKELNLVREISGKDAIIGKLEAEKYADLVTEAKVAPLRTEMCELKTQIAVNRARDNDFRSYVEREFVHQPKASMCDSIVTTTPCNCCCSNNTGNTEG